MPVKLLGSVFRDRFIQGSCALCREGVYDDFEVEGGLDLLLGNGSAGHIASGVPSFDGK